MAYIKVIDKTAVPTTNPPTSNKLYGKFKFITIPKHENVHDVTWHITDVMMTLNQEDVRGVTLKPTKFTKFIYDSEGTKIDEADSYGQSMVGVTAVVEVLPRPGTLDKNLGAPLSFKTSIGDFIALSCEPARNTSGGEERLYYKE